MEVSPSVKAGVQESRTGTDVDCDRLKKLFLSLSLSVEALHNHTALECEKIIQGQSQSTIPSNVAQETPQLPGDVEMGENSQRDINLGDNTMEVSPSVKAGVQESGTGTDVDCDRLKKLFLSHRLSFEALHNHTALECEKIIQGQSQSTIPSNVAQETPQLPGDVEMCENSQRDINLGDNTMEVSPSVKAGVQESGTSGYSGKSAEEYKMESNPRGFLLIINNKEFSGDLSVRTGTDVDCDGLKKLFLSLGFSVEVRHNLTALEMKVNLRLLSEDDKLHNVDCLAVALLTHGKEDYLLGVDGSYIHVHEAFKPFFAENCPALHHKPKLFIVNACRGDAEDKGSLTPGVYETNGPVSTDMNPVRPESGENCCIPNMTDFLIAYSTSPGYVSWRDQDDGSFFIQGFVDVFEKYAQAMDVLKMLVKVNDEVSKKGVQIPAPQFMLRKTWYLNPSRS